MYFDDLTGTSGLWLVFVISFIALTPLIYVYRKNFIEENKSDTENIYVSMNSFHE